MGEEEQLAIHSRVYGGVDQDNNSEDTNGRLGRYFGSQIGRTCRWFGYGEQGKAQHQG